MFKVVKDGTQIALVERPFYIRQLSAGVYTPATEDTAQGVAVDSVPYNLSGREAMAGLDEVVLIAFDGGKSIEELEAENKFLQAQIDAQSEQMDFYENCIVEMAEIVYA